MPHTKNRETNVKENGLRPILYLEWAIMTDLDAILKISMTLCTIFELS